MKFAQVAHIFQQIEQEPSRTQITVLLADLFAKTTASEAATIAYLTLGSLNPPYIGTQFNVAEKSLLKVIAHLTKTTIADVTAQMKQLGDIGLVVGSWSWAGGSDHLSITDVQRQLAKLEAVTGTGAHEVRETKLLQLLTAVDPVSAKYIMRMIDGNLRLGFSDMTLLDAFSWMATGDKSLRDDLEHAYNISADIGLIVATLKTDGIAGIQQMTIKPGIPIRPAAAERAADAAAVIKRLGPCVAQPKLDGFRLQVHLDTNNGHRVMRFFSRNLQDMSSMFPDLLAALTDLDVVDLVAEGEAICIDPDTGTFLPFQETVKRKRKHNIGQAVEEYPLRLYLFDLLYLNGVSLLDHTHAQRRKLLLEVCENKQLQKHAIIQPIAEVAVQTGDELYHYFAETVTRGLEGLVAKRSDAIYQPGKRNFNWIKLKREETGSLDDTVDCVILGYYAGQGKRAAFGIGALLVGIYNKKRDCFQTVAKIGTGMTDAELRELKASCDQIKVMHMPHNVSCAQALYPDVWVCPEIVCMIRADEITLSPLHRAGSTDEQLGYALRFPRFMGYRPDKSATDATTDLEIARLYALQFEKKAK